METILKLLVQHWHLSASQYWQLRLLFAISLVPFLALAYVVLFDKRTRFLAKLRNMGLKRPYTTRLFTSNHIVEANNARV